MSNTLQFEISRKKCFERHLKKLYQEILVDNLFELKDELARMAYYGHRQGQFFRLFREYQKISPENLSQKIGLSVLKIREIENGDFVPGVNLTALYADSIGATQELNYFLNFFDELL